MCTLGTGTNPFSVKVCPKGQFRIFYFTTYIIACSNHKVPLDPKIAQDLGSGFEKYFKDWALGYLNIRYLLYMDPKVSNSVLYSKPKLSQPTLATPFLCWSPCIYSSIAVLVKIQPNISFLNFQANAPARW